MLNTANNIEQVSSIYTNSSVCSGQLSFLPPAGIEINRTLHTEKAHRAELERWHIRILHRWLGGCIMPMLSYMTLPSSETVKHADQELCKQSYSTYAYMPLDRPSSDKFYPTEL